MDAECSVGSVHSFGTLQSRELGTLDTVTGKKEKPFPANSSLCLPCLFLALASPRAESPDQSCSKHLALDLHGLINHFVVISRTTAVLNRRYSHQYYAGRVERKLNGLVCVRGPFLFCSSRAKWNNLDCLLLVDHGGWCTYIRSNHEKVGLVFFSLCAEW